MATPATPQAEVAAQLQQQFRERIQGTDAVIGGDGNAINVNQEQSRRISKALFSVSADLQGRDPTSLNPAEMQILAMAQSLGPNGQVDGRQACQALILTSEIARGLASRTDAQSRKKALQAADAAAEIAVNVVPPEARSLGEKFGNYWNKKNLDADRTFDNTPVLQNMGMAEKIDQRRALAESHPIMRQYRAEMAAAEARKGSRLTGAEQAEVAMKEIRKYGDTEVDDLMKQVEDRKQAEIQEGKRLEAHRKKEDLQTELDQGKPKYEEQKARQKELQDENKDLAKRRDAVQDQIDDLSDELAHLPAGVNARDVEDMRRRISAGKVEGVASEAEIARLEAEKKFLEQKITDIKAGKEIVDVSAYRDTIQGFIDQQTESRGKAEGYRKQAEDLQAQQRALRKAHKDDEADELNDKIRYRLGKQAEYEARAQSLDAQISNVKDRIKDAEAKKGKVTPADIDAIRTRQAAIDGEIATAKKTKAEKEQEVKDEERKLSEAEKANNQRSDAEKEIRAKTRERDHLNDTITKNNTEVTGLEAAAKDYEDKQKELVGVEKFIKAAEQATQNAQKLAESGNVSADSIRTTFGFNATELPDAKIMKSMADCGFSAANIGEANTKLKGMKAFDLWRILLRAFGGAEVA